MCSLLNDTTSPTNDVVPKKSNRGPTEDENKDQDAKMGKSVL